MWKWSSRTRVTAGVLAFLHMTGLLAPACDYWQPDEVQAYVVDIPVNVRNTANGLVALMHGRNRLPR
jgi:hypothetical protein